VLLKQLFNQTTMKTQILFLVTIILAMIISCNSEKAKVKPLLAEAKPVDDVYFGKMVTDPYRYMENLKDSTVLNWIKSQSDYSRTILDGIPGRKELLAKMFEFDKRRAERVTGINITENDRYFYLKITPNDETGKLFCRDGFEGKETLLFDPLTFGKDTTQKFVISSYSPNDDGTKIAFEVAANGSESSVLLVMDVQNKTFYPERIDRCWFASPSWLPDGKSFLYNRLNSADVHDKNREKDSKTFHHQIGSDPSSDKEIFSKAKYPDLDIKSEEIPLIWYDKYSQTIFGIAASVDSRMKLYYAPTSDLNKEKINWKKLFSHDDQVYNIATTDKDIYVFTPKGAPNFTILKMSLKNPDLKKAEVVVPENPEGPITSFTLTSEALYYNVSVNGVRSKLFRLPNGSKKAEELTAPFPAGSSYWSSKGFKFPDIWVGLAGWTNNSKRYRFVSSQNTFKPENLSSVAEYPEYDGLVVEELMVPSHDGVKVPLSLIYKKNLKKDGSNAVIIYGYGAYGSSMTPYFSPINLLPVYEGGIYAVSHVRGGGELGDQWYKSGFKTTKPNTWKDLIACADYLVSEKYTSPKKIAINSGSAGGILIGRAMTDRPDLFAAAIPEVGCMNAIRMEESPNGPVNAPEFGTVKDSVECMALLEMDAYHHLKNGEKYPASLVTAGMNDPRVIAWQPAKFAARLQASNSSDKPMLFLVDYAAGHGIGDTKTKSFQNLADIFSFALWQTGHPKFQVK
jgi:prolyl oligopeptidase